MTVRILPTLTATQVQCNMCKLMVEAHACTYRIPDRSTIIYECFLCQVKEIENGGKEVRQPRKKYNNTWYHIPTLALRFLTRSEWGFTFNFNIEVTMKLNKINHVLSKKQVECLLLISLAQTRYKRPTFKDLRSTIQRTSTQSIFDAIKIGSTIQNLNEQGMITISKLPEGHRISDGKSVCSNVYELSEQGKEYLTVQVLNRAF